MSATALRPASSGTHAQVAVFRQVGWLPEDSGIADLGALRAEHERDVAAWEKAQAAVDQRASEHRANEQAVAESARRRAEGEDVPVIRPLPEAARQTELALARAEADAARDLLDARNEERFAVIEQRRSDWEQAWKGALGSDQAAIDELQAQIDALKERQRLSAVYLDWLADATDSREPTRWATVVDRLSEGQRAAIALAHGPEQVAEVLDEPVRRLTGRFSSQERLLRRAGSHTYVGDDEDEE